MESIGLPLIGDPLYRNKLPKPKEDGSVLNFLIVRHFMPAV